MKKMKKVLALALAMVMMLAMGMTAMAAPGDETPATYSISVKAGKEIPEGHTYKVYQIFTGKLDSTGEILSDIEYGQNYAGNAEYESAYEEAKTITDANVNAFAASITPIGDPVATLTHTETSATLRTSGYYLVIDESNVAAGTADQVSKFIVKVGGNIVIEPKVSDVPGFEKKVAGGDVTFDYAAGDPVPFTLTATMPEDVATYDSYQLTFKDELSTNLTLAQDTLKVVYKVSDAADEVEYAKDAYTVTVNGKNITVTMEDIGDAARVSGAKVIVKYNATLSADVTSGEVANNKASLEFGNNGDSQGVGNTTTEIVKVYTFALKFDKVDENGDALSGAGFTLYDAEGNAVGAEIKDVTEFTFDGLKAGTYTLEETTVPDGYNKMDTMTITVGATVNGETITVTHADGWTLNNFEYNTDITNYAGVELPSTGGIGTTIFYVIGGIMVLGAAVLLITKKRMSARN